MKQIYDLYKICAGACLAIVVVAAVACSIVIDNKTITDTGSGYMLVVNMTTHDTITVSGGLSDALAAQNGDIILLKYVPNEAYSKYAFTVKYTLPDGSEHSCTGKDYEYEFTLSDLAPGNHFVSFVATYEEEDIRISGGGKGIIDIPQVINIENITAIGSGNMLVVNTTTHDTITVSGGLTIGPSSDALAAQNGDIILLKYVPDEAYSKYAFTVKYTLPDGSEHSCTGKDYEYEFTLSDLAPGEHFASFVATYEENESLRHVSISGSGTVTINIVREE